MTTLATIRRAAPALAVIVPALLSQAALAQGFDKINTTVTNVNTILVTISIAVVTIAIIWAGFKMIFQGARLADVANVLIGGTLVGGAAAFGSYLVPWRATGWVEGEAIYKGATRPAMKLGIPLVPLVVLFGTGMLLIMWGGTLVSWWIALGVVVAFVPALLWMRFVTSKDDQRFRQMFVAMKLRLHDRNRRFWHARSYAPTLYRGARDAWHV